MSDSGPSDSRARSQIVNWSSAPVAANTDGSVGCHPTLVIGLVCHVNVAAAFGEESFEE